MDFLDLNQSELPFASAEFKLTVSIEPVMMTSHQESLALNIKSIELDGDIDYPFSKKMKLFGDFSQSIYLRNTSLKSKSDFLGACSI